MIDWREYEKRKKALPPDLSPTAYERECQRILFELEQATK